MDKIWNKIKEYSIVIGTLLIGVLGVLAWFYKERDVSNNNLETKEKILTKEKEIDNLNIEIKQETDKQEVLKEQLKKEHETQNESQEDLNNFFNDRYHPN